MKISVIMPSYNEDAVLEKCINSIYAENPSLDMEIIFVDDGSTDKTADIIQTIKKSGFKYLRHSKNLGKGAAVRTGLKQAKGDIILIQDADAEYNPADYQKLIAPIIEGKADTVYGSRILGKNNKKASLFYYMGGRFLSWWTNFLYGSHITDEPTCYKVFKADIIKSFNLKSQGFEFCPEVTAKILRKKITIHEVPISYNPRSKKEGKKIRFSDGLIALWTLLKLRFFE